MIYEITLLCIGFIFGFTVGICITVFIMLVPRLKRLIEVIKFMMENKDLFKDGEVR